MKFRLIDNKKLILCRNQSLTDHVEDRPFTVTHLGRIVWVAAIGGNYRDIVACYLKYSMRQQTLPNIC